MYKTLNELLVAKKVEDIEAKIVQTAYCPVIELVVDDKSYRFNAVGKTCDNPLLPQTYLYRDNSPYPSMPKAALEIHNRFRQDGMEWIPPATEAWIASITKKALGIFGGQ